MAQETFTFTIITPTTNQSFSVEWVEVESPTGSFLVGPDHLPLISIIKSKSVLTYKKTNSSIESHDVLNGIFKVTENQAIALLDQ
jgi:F0F1-type ATP synthase epsilon subunit